MKKGEYLFCSKNDVIKHKKYGLCTVVESSKSGILLRPVSLNGITSLFHDTHLVMNEFLEHDLNFLRNVRCPYMPYIIFQEDLVYEVHYWVNPGEIRPDGIFSTKLFKTYLKLKDAMKFCLDNPVSVARFNDNYMPKPWSTPEENKWHDPFQH